MAAQSFYQGITPVTFVKHTTPGKSDMFWSTLACCSSGQQSFLTETTPLSVSQDKAPFACLHIAVRFGASPHSQVSHNFSLFCLKNGTFAAFFLWKELLRGMEFLESEKDDFEMASSMGHPSETREAGSKITQVLTFLLYYKTSLQLLKMIRRKVRRVWLERIFPYWKAGNLCSKCILT